MDSHTYKRTGRHMNFAGWWKHMRPFNKRNAHKKCRASERSVVIYEEIERDRMASRRRQFEDRELKDDGP